MCIRNIYTLTIPLGYIPHGYTHLLLTHNLPPSLTYVYTIGIYPIFNIPHYTLINLLIYYIIIFMVIFVLLFFFIISPNLHLFHITIHIYMLYIIIL